MPGPKLILEFEETVHQLLHVAGGGGLHDFRIQNSLTRREAARNCAPRRRRGVSSMMLPRQGSPPGVTGRREPASRAVRDSRRSAVPVLHLAKTRSRCALTPAFSARGAAPFGGIDTAELDDLEALGPMT